jgi:hypothetical protein
MLPDPVEGRADLFRFPGFPAAGTPPAIGREAREAACRRVHVRETWWAIVCRFVGVAVAARVFVWMCPPGGTDTPPHAAISMPAN